MTKSSFRNSYLLMRHGESDTNVSGLILSDPKIGCERFGLTERASQQVIASAKGFIDEAITQIVCSDFLRTFQTAQSVADTLSLPQPEPEVGLRERYFGDWEGMSAEHYENLWQRDEAANQSDDQVESPEAVLQNGLNVLSRLEQQYRNK